MFKFFLTLFGKILQMGSLSSKAEIAVYLLLVDGLYWGLKSPRPVHWKSYSEKSQWITDLNNVAWIPIGILAPLACCIWGKSAKLDWICKWCFRCGKCIWKFGMSLNVKVNRWKMRWENPWGMENPWRWWVQHLTSSSRRCHCAPRFPLRHSLKQSKCNCGIWGSSTVGDGCSGLGLIPTQTHMHYPPGMSASNWARSCEKVRLFHLRNVVVWTFLHTRWCNFFALDCDGWKCAEIDAMKNTFSPFSIHKRKREVCRVLSVGSHNFLHSLWGIILQWLRSTLAKVELFVYISSPPPHLSSPPPTSWSLKFG